MKANYPLWWDCHGWGRVREGTKVIMLPSCLAKVADEQNGQNHRDTFIVFSSSSLWFWETFFLPVYLRIIWGWELRVYLWYCLCCAVLSHVQLFATPWTVALQASLPMGFSQQEYWKGLPCPPPGDLLDPGIKLVSPALAGRFLTTESPGKPIYGYYYSEY